MNLDPVLAEIRQARAAYSEKFRDVHAMLEDIRRRQESSGHPVATRQPKRINERSSVVSDRSSNASA
jgi:hypothetical protein